MNKHQEEEFLSAYDDFSDKLFRYCYFKIDDRDVAKDIVQDVFLNTWSYMQKGNDVKNFKAFLYRLANNIIIDWYRKKKAISLDILSEDGFDPTDTMAHTESHAELEQAMKVLSRLNKDEQDLIVWRYVEELSIKEISEIISQKENVVSVRLHRALSKLRSLLG